MPRTITIDVHYPPTADPLELHIEDDWPAARPADRVSDDGTCRSFELELDRPSLAFKPVLARGDERLWARGENFRVPVGVDRVEVYPHFEPDAAVTVDPEPALDDPARGYRFQTFLPPGYAENPLRRFPVVLLHDGQRALFPDDPPADRLVETLAVLGALNAVAPAVYVGVRPEDPETWTRPAYAAYANHVVQELLPKVEDRYRTNPDTVAAVGVGQGGVAAFYLAWEWPGVVSRAACLAGTFGARDNLLERVGTESVRETRLYLDATRPQGLEPSRTVWETLRHRGHAEADVTWFAFPEARPPAISWAVRHQLALQVLFRP